MGKMSELYIEMQENGELDKDDPDMDFLEGLSTEILASNIADRLKSIGLPFGTVTETAPIKCERSLEHVQVHLNSIKGQDLPQDAHEMHMAALLLLEMMREIDGKYLGTRAEHPIVNEIQDVIRQSSASNFRRRWARRLRARTPDC